REFNERQTMPQLSLETRSAIQQQQQTAAQERRMSPSQIGGSPLMETKIAAGLRILISRGYCLRSVEKPRTPLGKGPLLWLIGIQFQSSCCFGFLAFSTSQSGR